MPDLVTDVRELVIQAGEENFMENTKSRETGDKNQCEVEATICEDQCSNKNKAQEN